MLDGHYNYMHMCMRMHMCMHMCMCMCGFRAPG